MIFGKKTPRDRRSLHTASVVVRWLVAVALGAQLLPAAAFELPDLMTLLGQHRSGEAQFSEQRFVQGLDAPLLSSGTLRFDAPDRLLRKTLQPRVETMVVEGNTVVLSRGSRSRTFTLDAAPEMLGLIEAIRGTLGGNARTVERYFKPELSGSAEQWTLALTPLEARLAELLRSIRISGRRADVTRIETLLADGDRSLMTIDAARTPAASAAAASAP